MATLSLWVAALVLGIMVWRKHGTAVALRSMQQGARRALGILPRLIMIIVVAGFLFRLLPDGFVAQMLGPDSGLGGVLFATLIGGLIPGGGSITFSIIVLLHDANAGTVQLITLVTAWSVFAMHRVLIHEIPLMGVRFSMVRLISSLPLPLTAAAITALFLAVWP
jgi:hypothetical protein